ncbi:MerR family transcriptional regulator [Streptomyces iconiensis]|uniref:MerR family transcriptional regulator n=1 Tax=Streptomyces iconiensis TaxID=1384038 RepID=A0ABT6ZZA4_9ACTN|nr:MerR family transcriptional regulator [Streptomyces iconiensis]MDJ1134384.1 MerR family transcriptional regulator [Streptomyces iconiensis]
MRIGEVAEQAGVSVRALRYYEEQRLLPADRSAGGQRHYPDSAVERVRLIQQLYAAGLASTTVRQVLPCVDSGEEPPALLDRLVTERALIEQKITDLLTARDRLDDVIGVARNPDPDCTHGQ